MPDKQKLINSKDPDDQFTKDSGHGKLVQLVFVNHMSSLKKSIVAFPLPVSIYCMHFTQKSTCS